jgi:metal-responsive CopG/Arc/MetJ family transcriptional regulator
MRKREVNKNNNGIYTQISVRLKSELILKIEGLAKEEYRNRNNMLECLLDRAVKHYKAENGRLFISLILANSIEKRFTIPCVVFALRND